MQLSDFNFDLPPELIARYPLETRSESRLLCISQQSSTLIHKKFHDILDLLHEGDLLVFNDTKVIPARLYATKNTGGHVEILVERVLDDERILAQVRASKPLRTGSYLSLSNHEFLEVVAHRQQFYELRYNSRQTILAMIEALGEIPLPPYMQRAPEDADKIRYQTIYAKHKGSVAAPTAGFHVDEALLNKIQDKKIDIGFLTLHIGAGTFAPVRIENIHEHKMHAEYLEVSDQLCVKIAAAKARGKRVIAVGTTSLRALETASQSGRIAPYEGETSIFIYPGYQFRCADSLITNLHLPRSTLLMLVCAFGGFDKVMQAYQEAVQHLYRFYSYGDAMWIERM